MNQSSTERERLLAAISGTVMRWQDATEAFDETVGALYSLNAAERHCLSLLWQGPLPPGVIAREIGLTPPSVTALVDRLEKRGFVRREPDPEDRRKIRIVVTRQTEAMTKQTYLPLAAKGRELLECYSDAELAVIARFCTEALAVQEEATRQLRSRAQAAQ